MSTLLFLEIFNFSNIMYMNKNYINDYEIIVKLNDSYQSKNYKYLYKKYKTKYINLLKKYNQVGGNNTDNLNKIIKMYKKIPETGLYDKNISLQKFIKYCKFIINKTKDDPDILDLKRKIFLEKKRMKKTNEYKKLIKKISGVGKKYQKFGQDFEK